MMADTGRSRHSASAVTKMVGGIRAVIGIHLHGMSNQCWTMKRCTRQIWIFYVRGTRMRTPATNRSSCR